jgi:hypothetical protein
MTMIDLLSGWSWTGTEHRPVASHGGDGWIFLFCTYFFLQNQATTWDWVGLARLDETGASEYARTINAASC